MLRGPRPSSTRAHVPGRRRVAPAVVAALTLTAVAVACSGGGGAPGELDGWRRGEVRRHHDVADAFDRVAVDTHTDGVAWLTWDHGGSEALAYWRLDENRRVRATPLPMPDDPVLIPVAVATDREGWSAVAVTRERANGDNTGMVAWHSRARAGPAPVRLGPAAPGLQVPERVSAGRYLGTSVITGVVDGAAVMWVHDPDDAPEDAGRRDAGSRGARPVRPAHPDLGLDEGLVTLDVAGDGERLVLAGVDDDGDAHLWTSTDARTWDAVTTGELPAGTESVRILGPLGHGELAIGWLAQGGEDTPRSGPAATVQRVTGDDVTTLGTIEADPEAGTTELSVAGATWSPGGNLVVVGAVWRPAGVRTPMVWVHDGEGWHASEQPDMAGRLDHELRAVTTASGRTMHALVTPFPRHVDVEVWEWRDAG